MKGGSQRIARERKYDVIRCALDLINDGLGAWPVKHDRDLALERAEALRVGRRCGPAGVTGAFDDVAA